MDDDLLFDRYYNLALRFLSFRPRSEKEVVEYLKKKIKKPAATASTSNVAEANAAKAEESTETQKFSASENFSDSVIAREALVNQIISKLKEYNFINDVEFTKLWIGQRIKSKHKPLRVIEFELKQKGINKEIIDEVLSRFDESRTLDQESAEKLASKKLDFYRSLPPQKRREKVTSFLLRKGFNYDIVKKVVK